MTKPLDPDLKALKRSIKAMDQSSCRRMLLANLEFLVDHYIRHPSKEIHEHLREPGESHE